MLPATRNRLIVLQKTYQYLEVLVYHTIRGTSTLYRTLARSMYFRLLLVLCRRTDRKCSVVQLIDSQCRTGGSTIVTADGDDGANYRNNTAEVHCCTWVSCTFTYSNSCRIRTCRVLEWREPVANKKKSSVELQGHFSYTSLNGKMVRAATSGRAPNARWPLRHRAALHQQLCGANFGTSITIFPPFIGL